MKWMYVVVVFAAVIAIGRIYQQLRRARAQRDDDWDARLVKELRAGGGNSFTLYDVDFFFHVPDTARAEALQSKLAAEGYRCDVREMRSEGASGYSLHATHGLRVTVPAMQELSTRFRALAEQHGGNYDGWSTSPARVTASGTPAA